MTLVAYQVDYEQVIDLSEAQVLAGLGIAAQTLSCPWEELASRGEVPPTWALSGRLISDGCAGVVVPSFAPGSDPTDLNLVLWRWSNGLPCRVVVIDDFARLPRDDAS
jgi:RES domain-containing protein